MEMTRLLEHALRADNVRSFHCVCLSLIQSLSPFWSSCRRVRFNGKRCDAI